MKNSITPAAQTTTEKPFEILGRGQGRVFVQIGSDVHRCAEEDLERLDIWKLPCGRRWECKRAHFDHYRNTVYGWVKTEEAA